MTNGPPIITPANARRALPFQSVGTGARIAEVCRSAQSPDEAGLAA